MTETTFSINGKAYPLDMEDYETAKRFQEAFKCLDSLNVDEMYGNPESIQRDCEIMDGFFLNLFGENVFEGEPYNRRNRIAAVGDLFAFIKKQRIEDAVALLDVFKKYSPQNNQTQEETAEINEK